MLVKADQADRDTGDFRLMDRKVCEQMKRIKESDRFVRGLVSWVVFRQTAIEYVRGERFAGETKYPLKRMIKLWLDGILSFSHKPLKLDALIKGWSSIISILLVFNGLTLFILGILGEYIGRIYVENEGRPLYIVKDIFGEET